MTKERKMAGIILILALAIIGLYVVKTVIYFMLPLIIAVIFIYFFCKPCNKSIKEETKDVQQEDKKETLDDLLEEIKKNAIND
ncbi:MAG: hypothetical protein RSE41_00810 [Clostridia bacterium]